MIDGLTTLNAQRPTLNVQLAPSELKCWALGVERWALLPFGKGEMDELHRIACLQRV